MFNLRRITSDQNFIPQIDGLRFIAIISVVLFHLHGVVKSQGVVTPGFSDANFEQLSKRGVELFFAISGFILTLPFARSYLAEGRQVNLSWYFLRRLTRLEPPYVLNLLLLAVWRVVARQISLRNAIPHLLASLTYLHWFFFKAGSTINGVAWSLEVEAQFYVLAPLFAKIFIIPARVRRPLMVCLIFAIGLCTRNLGKTLFHLTIVYYLSFFLAGVFIADIYLEHAAHWSSSKSFGWDVFSIALWPVVWWPGEAFSHSILALVLIGLFLAAFRGIVTSAFLSLNWVTIIGGMCYTIYLYHATILLAAGRLTKSIHFGNSYALYFLVQGIFAFAAVLLICTFLFVWIERPFMDKSLPHRLSAFLKRLTSAWGKSVDEVPSI